MSMDMRHRMRRTEDRPRRVAAPVKQTAPIPDTVPEPTHHHSPSLGGVNWQTPNTSVRFRRESAERDAREEEFVKPLPNITPAGTAQWGFNTNLRDRQRWAEFMESEKQAAATATSSVADYYLNLHKQREAEAAAEEAEQIRSGRLRIL